MRQHVEFDKESYFVMERSIDGGLQVPYGCIGIVSVKIPAPPKSPKNVEPMQASNSNLIIYHKFPIAFSNMFPPKHDLL